MRFRQVVLVALLSASLFFFLGWRKSESALSALYLSWLKDPTSTMLIQWHKKNDPSACVYYQKSGDSIWQCQEGNGAELVNATLFWGKMYVHRVELTDLEPDTEYAFKLANDPEIYRFRTMPKEGERPLHFVVGGDIYQNDVCQFKKMMAQVAKHDPDFVVLGGDIAYTRGFSALLRGRYFEIQRWKIFFKAWKEQMVTGEGRLIPMVVVLGNHDLESTHVDPKKKPVLFYELFAMPNLFSYRTLDFGNYLSFFLLDTGHTYPIAGEQTLWLENALKARQQVLQKIAIYHIAAYPSVNDYQKKRHKQIRKNWVPLFEKYDVEAAFEHHDHTFKRTFRLKGDAIDPSGVLYLGDGGWGVSPRHPQTPEELWYIEKSLAANFVYLVSIQQDKGIAQAIDTDGNLLDSVDLTR